jgi:hypothetical protein
VRPEIALLALLLSSSPREVVVGAGESLADVSRRELGDASAESELRALNHLPADAGVPPGTRLRLPGEDRERALKALGAARNAISQTDSGEVGKEARSRLDEAESLFVRAEYVRAAEAADEAWKRVSEQKSAETAFSVEVSDGGTTKVTSRAGTPVRVEAQGVQREVNAGQTLSVARGEAPPVPRAAPPPVPVLSFPGENAKLKLKPDSKGNLGPVQLAWKKSNTAHSYRVEVVSDLSDIAPITLESATPFLSLPPLPPGHYRWRVLAQGGEALNSEPSAMRRFELVVEPLKLEVRQPIWK